MWRAFPHVMLIDATYKTNLYNMPFVQVVGVTSTGKSFCIAHAVICKERRGNYVWVLERIKSILHECMMSRVIVTDRELALINVCSKVFPNATRLLCQFHIEQNIVRQCKKGFDKEDWGKFMTYWRRVCESTSEPMYKYNLEKMCNRLVVANRESVYDYVYENWLKDYKEMFVYAWTDKCRNFGQRTTNRVESQHANLKRYITRGSSLVRIARCVIDIVETQYDEIQKSFTESIEKTINHHRHPLLDNLRGKVSHEALDLLAKELMRKLEVLRKLNASCGCHMWLSCGLPCACRLENYKRTDWRCWNLVLATFKECYLDQLVIFQGVLPRSIGNLSSQLRSLHLGFNWLHGYVPSSIGNLVGLTTLHLSFNRFIGKIPSTIGRLKNLQLATFVENQFSGQIPDEIGNLTLMTKLALYSNKLEGHIPSSLGNLHQVIGLDLSNNKLTGEIPKELLELSSLSYLLNLSQNHLFGSLPSEVGKLNMLGILDLSYNNITGNIPSSLGGCQSLSSLSLKGNLFQGIIPPSLRSLRGLVDLDVSHNNLTGQILEFFQEFSLNYINLSFNDFEGEVPVLGVFANASAFSVLGNSRLCGGLIQLGLPKCEAKKHRKRFPVYVIVILIASTLFIILCLVYSWCKKKSKSQASQSSTNERFLKVSYNELLKATDGFSEANLIGQGGFSSVYKGILGHVDRSVAVKVLHLQSREARKSFVRECEAWRSIRHRNLLKIITSCSSVDFQGNDFKAIVYEFMPNGSLHDWLHSSTCTSRLNLVQRINILMNVACALDYLHNHCPTAIVHGDLKPSDILLDDDMVAHVGDFGLARFLGSGSNRNNSSGVKGTIGYAPPGLGSEMTSSGDVYSFGISLLEVMTRKRPTGDIFINGLSLHKFAHMALPDHVIDVIDSDILNFFQEDASGMQTKVPNAEKMEECLDLIVKIGVSCSVDSPTQQMHIESVVHEVKHILNMLQNV
ncbi:putative protein kinase RLK-Pelle-LRR-XII-1 family [Helianthus annuus]|nr:putative protein kinase RLK-Pelle-LRR-XII-1 family [Helianthus annuus]KAJ0487552.1 putative protein kinase RLK-Pelle-LRR-XII-1 family [Helianthus annuus]KAJ0657998.1 putative protein kinase RLK-Pelle-LRR-XII-1 family [Helianthus annuus]KAJ0661685.1 putative protein kinase RLK-Pelle-LRR-XII-1 family [Helianthus annuus]